MAPKYSKEPGARYKYGSTKHKEEIHYEAVYENGLFNHNNPWLIKHDEELLNRAHRKESPYCIGEKLGRKPHSLACRLSKLAINHPMARYRFPPSWTPWRSHRGFFWSGLDRYIFSLATGKSGLEYGAYKPEYICGILYRTPEAVRDFYRKSVSHGFDIRQQRGFGAVRRKPVPTGDRDLAEELHIIVRSTVPKDVFVSWGEKRA